MPKKLTIVLILILLGGSLSFAREVVNVFALQDTTQSLPADTTKADTTVKVIVDTLKPIFVKENLNVYESPILLTKKELDRTDYKYFGDWFDFVPFGFLQNLGSLGKPSEANLFGVGYGGINVLSDGVEINNHATNALDFYTIRSELTDSFYIPAPVKSFIYGVTNKPAAVLINTYDRLSAKPYSRIRYYQAPNSEGFIDGFFNIYPAKKFNLYGGFQNSSVESYYSNSEFGLWNATLKARYLFNNTFNFIFSYNYSHSRIGLNGGVDYTGLLAKYPAQEAERILYSPFEAPVVYGDRYRKNTKHLLNFKVLMRLGKNSVARLNAFYNTNLNEYRQDEKTPQRIMENDRSKFYGVNLVFPFSLGFTDFSFRSTITNTNLNLNSLGLQKNIFAYSFAGDAVVKFNRLLNAEAFAKYLNYNSDASFGFGGQLNFQPFKKVFISGGISWYSLNKNIEEFVLTTINSPGTQNVSSVFVSLGVNNNYGKLELRAFQSNFDSFEEWVENTSAKTSKLEDKYLLYYHSRKTSGVNLNANLKFYKFLLQANLSYYFKDEKSLWAIPRFSAFGGIYYVDTLFNGNLHLKTGVNFYSNGAQAYRQYEFRFDRAVYYKLSGSNGNVVEPLNPNNIGGNWDLDLFLAGTIQERATLYVTLQNVFDNQYFIVPYYPMPGITFRFGIAWEFYN